MWQAVPALFFSQPFPDRLKYVGRAKRYPSASACVDSTKPKITIHLRRKLNGEVIADILNERAELVAYKRFGMMTEDEHDNAMQQVKKEFPGAAVWLLIDAGVDRE